MKAISTKQAPAAIGPYSQAVQVGNLLFTSGQIPINPATGVLPRVASRSRRGSHSST